MATYSIYYDKKRLALGKEVKALIRITQNKKHAYQETGIYLSPAQVDKKFEVKDDDILATILQIRKKYKKLIDEGIGEDVASYKASDIKKFIEKKLKGDEVDFFEFADKYLSRMSASGRTSTAAPILKSVRGFRDFIKKDKLGCNEINLELLENFGDYLKKKRKVARTDQFGILREREFPPLDDFGVGKYYIDLQSVFNAAKEAYNDEETGVYIIKRNPFKRLEIRTKRGGSSNRSVEIETFRKILHMDDTPFRRVNMARDAILLSFMLLGMPPADLYSVNEYKNGRISYKRMKTKDRREDGAFMSIKVYPEAASLIEKYKDQTGERVFVFHKLYSSAHVFSSNMNIALKQIKETCGIDENLTMYVARHTVGTLLRNHFRMPKSDVGECLNHSAGAGSVTDYYIKKDFSMIDETAGKLIAHLFAYE